MGERGTQQWAYLLIGPRSPKLRNLESAEKGIPFPRLSTMNGRKSDVE